MSYRRKLLLVNNFIQTLESEIRSQIDNYIDGDYNMDDIKVLAHFGLEDQFKEYVAMYG